MKTTFLVIIICSIITPCLAQFKNYDSIAYENQRAKINNMLARRKLKFGQYEESLSMHTGIFGLQTKKDIRRSNDILMDIAQTDDAIFKELKVLLSYRNNQLDLRTLQQKQSQAHAKETQDLTLGFVQTINKLRDQNDKLKADLSTVQKQYARTTQWLTVALVISVTSILFLLLKKRRAKV